MAAQHHNNVDNQFGEQANAYLTSAVHARGRDLVTLGERLCTASDARLLDLGCGAGGAGHASFIAAQYVREVVAYDLSEKMLTVVEQTARARWPQSSHHLPGLC